MNPILLDIGGSYIKCADGRKIPIDSAGPREAIAASLRLALGDADAAGIAIPGPFDYRNGIFLMRHKFASVYGLRFADLLSKMPEEVVPSVAKTKADAPEGTTPSGDKKIFRFMHDVNAPLAGAIRQLGLKNAALMTLGTGLGFSYALDGKVQENESGSPAISLWNRPWNGGILEDGVSARALSGGYTRKSGQPCRSAYDVACRAAAGDLVAQEVYSDLGALLGEALRPLLEELGIRTLLMGGQISRSLNLMIRPLQNALEGVTIAQAPEDAVFAGLKTLFEPK